MSLAQYELISKQSKQVGLWAGWKTRKKEANTEQVTDTNSNTEQVTTNDNLSTG